MGIRTGAIRGIDVEDFKPEQKTIQLKHRPEQIGVRGTPPKNKSDGERHINISDELRDLLIDYLHNPDRPEGTGKFGRRPLFTVEDTDGTFGRIGVNRVRDDFYKVTRPCAHGKGCPIGRGPDDCKAEKNRYAYKCPKNYSPHPLRSWSIMHQLDQGILRETLSNRVDVSVPVLEAHYDHRDPDKKREARLEKLEGKLPGYGEPEDADDNIDLSPSMVHPVFGLLVVGTALGKVTYDRLN